MVRVLGQTWPWFGVGGLFFVHQDRLSSGVDGCRSLFARPFGVLETKETKEPQCRFKGEK